MFLRFQQASEVSSREVFHSLTREGDTVLDVLERDARKAKKDLWADPQPVLLWERQKRKEHS